MRLIHQLKSTRLCVRLVRKLRQIEAMAYLFERPETNYALMGFSPGRHQKSAGAWSWELYVKDESDIGWRPLPIGGVEPASKLVRKDVKIGYTEPARLVCDFTVFSESRDACQVCHGMKGGVPGNENIVDGVVMCDYCHAEKLKEDKQ